MRRPAGTSDAHAPYAVWAVGLGAVILTVSGLALVPSNRAVPEAGLGDFAIPDFTAGVLFSGIGSWLAGRRPRNAMGWLILIVGAGAAVSFFTTQYAAAALVSHRSWGLPLGGAAAILAQSAFIVPNVVQRGLILYAFPEGRLGTRAGRILVGVSVVAGVAFVLAALASPYPWYEARPDVAAPLAPRLTGFSNAFYQWFGRLFAPVTALCMGALVLRLVRGAPPLRAALVWFSIAASVSFVQFSVVQAFFPDFSEPIWLDAGLATLGLVAMAGASVVAVLRYRLWDMQVILRRSLLFFALTMCLAGAYLGVVAAVTFVLPGTLLSSLAAAVVVASVAVPLRTSLRHALDRFLFGDRHDPDSAMARLGRRLGAVKDIDETLAEVAAGIAASLRVPYVALYVMDGTGLRLAAHCGHDTCGTEELALVAHGDDVGRLVIGRREPHLVLEGPDRRLLDDLSRQAAVAAAIVTRTHELQVSRQRLVSAREEERRRLRRDLHDGIGPVLAATTLQLDEAADLVDDAPDAARRLLLGLRNSTQELIADVRRLVYELRPPALDELGLVPALRQHADSLSGSQVVFDVDAEPERVQLPAAVEVALWRIATEAMTNVVRHAGARHCTVRLRVGKSGQIELEVADDGRGIDGARPGVGLTSARERAVELGGQCTISARQAGGTLLLATLPVPEP